MDRFLKVNIIYYSIGFAILIVIPFFVEKAWNDLVIEIYIMAIAASAANLMAGYSGMVSFGVAGFYGIGSYITAILITRAGIPFEIAFLAGPLGAAILSIPIGWFCVRRTAIYFAMLSLAFSQLIYVIIFTWYSFTGGDDGIVGVQMPAYLNSTFSYYYFSLIILIVCLCAMWRLVNSPFGKTLQALRDNPDRAGFIGINVRRYQYSVYIVSSFFLAVAGSLQCGFNQNVFADYAHWAKTFEITIVYLLGGIHNFIGPTIGSIIFIIANKIITRHTEYWPITLGIVIILITIFMPNGVAGFVLSRLSGFKREKERLL